VADAIDQLPFKQQIVVILFYLHDMNLSEISAIVNVPPGTVKSRLYYGRARLRELLQDDERLPAQGVLRYVSN
jgi:RNA polymerase sigma-70 factor (ECF subfamily)